MRLLDEIVEAHGGLDAWRGTDRVRLRARSGGLLLRTRAPGDGFADVQVEVGIGSVHASAAPFPGPGRRGVYADGAVRIETDAGEVVESRRNPRPCFFGRAGIRRNFRWDELDLVYFAGYAWWNYLNHPLLLTREDVAVVEAEPMRRDGQTWRRLDATFPAGLDTHSAGQSFFYDGDLRLRRHDYVAEVVGRWAHAAHMCSDGASTRSHRAGVRCRGRSSSHSTSPRSKWSPASRTGDRPPELIRGEPRFIAHRLPAGPPRNRVGCGWNPIRSCAGRFE